MTMATTITVEVSYSQLSVFASSLKQPFNDWTERHVSQGFAWRPGSVSFRSLVESGPHSIEIDAVDRMGSVHDDAVRVVEVPFEVPADGDVEIGSITETIPVSLPAGSFLLRCEFLQSASSGNEHVRLTFARSDTPQFAVVRADPELMPDEELLTEAEPAPG